MQYALDAIEDPALPRPDRLVLISPMIGITAFARFAGIAGWPAVFPAFARAAWLSVVPEFIPFKYNSFPINGARQSFQLTRALQAQIDRQSRGGKLGELPPILTFQSVVDFTVSTRSIITALYARLPANGSELVLFDLNRTIKFGPLLSTGADLILNRVLPPPPRDFRTTILANEAPDSAAMVERTTEAGATDGGGPPARPHLSRWASSPSPTSPCPSRSRTGSTACAPTPRTISASSSAPSPPAASAAP